MKDLDTAPAEHMPEPLHLSVEIYFGPNTRWLTEQSELRDMAKSHLSALIENYTTGPKPMVIVNFVNHGNGYK